MGLGYGGMCGGGIGGIFYAWGQGKGFGVGYCFLFWVAQCWLSVLIGGYLGSDLTGGFVSV